MKFNYFGKNFAAFVWEIFQKLNGSLMSSQLHLSLHFYRAKGSHSRGITRGRGKHFPPLFSLLRFTPSYHWPTSFTLNSLKATEKLVAFLCMGEICFHGWMSGFVTSWKQLVSLLQDFSNENSWNETFIRECKKEGVLTQQSDNNNTQ